MVRSKQFKEYESNQGTIFIDLEQVDYILNRRSGVTVYFRGGHSVILKMDYEDLKRDVLSHQS